MQFDTRFNTHFVIFLTVEYTWDCTFRWREYNADEQRDAVQFGRLIFLTLIQRTRECTWSDYWEYKDTGSCLQCLLRQNRNVASFVCIKAYCLKFIMNRRVYLCQESFHLTSTRILTNRYTFRDKNGFNFLKLKCHICNVEDNYFASFQFECLRLICLKNRKEVNYYKILVY